MRMWIRADTFRVKLGGNTYINVPTLVEFNGSSLLAVERHTNNGIIGTRVGISIARNQIGIG